jgi:hypothetical protein
LNAFSPDALRFVESALRRQRIAEADEGGHERPIALHDAVQRRHLCVRVGKTARGLVAEVQEPLGLCAARLRGRVCT